MKNLQLMLETKWFDMTAAKIKPEDYREITPYWVRRFYDMTKAKPYVMSEFIEWLKNKSFYKDSEETVLKRLGITKKQFSKNIMTKGYPKSHDTSRILVYEHLGIEVRSGKEECGAETSVLYFVILHGEQLLNE